jgi:aspartate carbamoyltransferase catalytic subunit
VVSGYYDIIVLRHPNPEAFREFVSESKVPVINAGSGAEEHPTQALLDAYTARNELAKHGKDINGSHIAFTGDLKYGRTVHSLIKLLSLYQGLTFYLISTRGLELPESVMAIAKAAGHKIIYCTNMKEGVQNADIIYATRLQRERFSREELLGVYPELAIDFDLIDVYAKENVVIMHPLPRDSRPGSHDLSVTLNKDPRLAIFSQTDNGVVVRMALFSKILDVDNLLKASLEASTWYKPSTLEL